MTVSEINLELAKIALLTDVLESKLTIVKGHMSRDAKYRTQLYLQACTSYRKWMDSLVDNMEGLNNDSDKLLEFLDNV